MADALVALWYFYLSNIDLLDGIIHVQYITSL